MTSSDRVRHVLHDTTPRLGGIARNRRPAGKPIGGALYSKTTAVENVRVDHRRPHIGVTRQFLDSADVGPALQQMRRETVPERVRPHRLRDPCPSPRLADGARSSYRLNSISLHAQPPAFHQPQS